MDSDAPASDDDTLATLSTLLADVPPELEPAVDAAVRDADDAETLVADLEELLAGGEHGDDGDDADAGDPVGGADSLSELRETLAGRAADSGDGRVDGTTAVEVTVDGTRAVETANRARERASTAGSDAVDRLKSGLGGLRDRVGDADGEDDGVELPPARIGESEEGSRSDPGDGDGTGAAAGTDDAERTRSTGVDSSPPSDDPDARSLPVPDPEDTRRTLARARTRAGSGVADLKYTLRNADPKRAAIWGLATGATLANPAIAAGYSTAVLLSGAVLGGTAVGAYATSHEGTVLDDLDPLEMARSANGVAAANRGRSNVNGAAMGSVLGATSYVAGQVTPEEYAHWLADVDLDTVARGAELGAGAARERDDLDLDLDSGAAGALLGGGLGAAYGLATEGGEDDAALRELLDADLYDDYRRSLEPGEGGDGGDGPGEA